MGSEKKAMAKKTSVTTSNSKQRIVNVREEICLAGKKRTKGKQLAFQGDRGG